MSQVNESRSQRLLSRSRDLRAGDEERVNPPLGHTHPTRVVYLDNLRVFLTILVIVHHIAASYGDVGVWYWNEPVSGPASAIIFTFVMAINQAFFMGFFFLLAGYFVPSSAARKGTRAFLSDRLVRLGVPLLTYIFLIHPIVWRLGHGGEWQVGTGPMWFVEVLLLFTVAYVVLMPLLPAYILHPIVLVSLALVLRDVSIPSSAKFALTLSIAVPLLFGSAHYIRRMPLLRRVL